MVTAQHSKAGRFAVDEEDYVIILKPENGGLYQMFNPTVGFREEKPDPTITLPNIDNPSDHYPVGATLIGLSIGFEKIKSVNFFASYRSQKN